MYGDRAGRMWQIIDRFVHIFILFSYHPLFKNLKKICKLCFLHSVLKCCHSVCTASLKSEPCVRLPPNVEVIKEDVSVPKIAKNRLQMLILSESN